MRPGMIALYDRESSYGAALSEYIQRQGSSETATALYTEEAALQKEIDTGRVDLVVVIEPDGRKAGTDETEAREKSSEETACKRLCGVLQDTSIPVLRLTEERSRETGKLYKYQSARKILQTIEYTRRNRWKNLGDKTATMAKIRGVYAPVGGCLKTSLAIVMGCLLSETRRVLYVNLEAHSGFSTILDCKSQLDLADLLAKMRQGQDEMEMLPQVIQSYEGLSYLAPVLWPEDIYETTLTEWKDLLGRLSGCGQFDEIILDVGQDIPYPEEVMLCCDRIYRPIRPDAFSQAKNEEYDRYLSLSNRGELLNRTTRIPLSQVEVMTESFHQWKRWEQLIPVMRKILEEEGPENERKTVE